MDVLAVDHRLMAPDALRLTRNLSLIARTGRTVLSLAVASDRGDFDRCEFRGFHPARGCIDFSRFRWTPTRLGETDRCWNGVLTKVPLSPHLLSDTAITRRPAMAVPNCRLRIKVRRTRKIRTRMRRPKRQFYTTSRRMELTLARFGGAFRCSSEKLRMARPGATSGSISHDPRGLPVARTVQEKPARQALRHYQGIRAVIVISVARVSPLQLQCPLPLLHRLDQLLWCQVLDVPIGNR